MQDGMELAVVNRGNQRAERGAKAEGDGVTEAKAEVADGEAEGEAADSPEDAHQQWPSDAGVRRLVSRAQNLEEVGDKKVGNKSRHDQPRRDALDDPVNFP